MGKRMNNFLLTVLLGMLVILYGTDVFARADYSKANTVSLSKTQTDKVTQSMLNIGNWGFWITHDGQTGHDPFTGSSGGYYPRGTDAAIYMDGIIWGGWMRDVASEDIPLRVGGIGYEVGTVPGWIDDAGEAVDTDNERVRLYRIRSDWATLSAAQVSQDAAEHNNVAASLVTEAMTDEIIARYRADWKDWPVDLGAPYVDVDGDGTYNPVLDADGYADPLAGDYPGIANADQIIWIVVNDLNEGAVNSHSGAPPIGLELQVTLWGYNQPAAGLGQITFKKYRFINKSGTYIDSMFVAQYSDPDVGDYSDDLVGCDTSLSLHYVYNGNLHDAQYDDFDLVPPSAGYDFFQGPLVATGDPADVAVFDLKYKTGHVNLPMTAFGYFAAGGDISDPTMGVYSFTENWYNMLNGFIPTDDLEDPTPFYLGSGPDAGATSKFPASGDPVTDLDGSVSDIDGKGTNMPPGDRRMFACSGPFVMAPNDTQEVVVALVGGIGSDNLGSVSDMKNTDLIAQKLFDDLFATVPKPPAGPKLTATPFENSIVLNWGADADAVAATEVENPLTGYDFEGYVVYQLPKANSSISEGVMIKTYDLMNEVTTIHGPRFVSEYGMVVNVPVLFGQDAGIKRFFNIEKDYVTGGRLLAGTTYHFAVTAYNYNANPQLIQDQALESGLVISSVTMQGATPGVRYEGTAGETLEVTAGANNGSNGSVVALIVDPSATTGHSYSVTFHVDDDTASATYNETVYNLVDDDLGVAVLENQPQLAVGTTGNEVPVVDGLQVKVYGPALIIGDWGWEDVGVVSPLYPDYADGRCISGEDFGGNALFGGLGMAHIFWGAPPGVAPADFKTVELRFTHMESYTDTDGNGEYTFTGDGGEPYTFNLDEGQKAFAYNTWGAGHYKGFFDIPFQAWDVDDPANPRQLNVVWRDRDENDQWDLGTGGGPYNYVWIMADTYDPTGVAWDASTPDKDFMTYLDDGVPAYYTLWGIQRGSRPFLARDGILTAIPNRVNTSADEFTFTAPAVSFSDADAKEDVKNISVFPNPYYANNSLGLNRFDRFVTFTHLPQVATVRIFNLAGLQVRKLEKEDDTQFMQWDLQNEETLPVASGLYIAHIDMPDLNKTKVLKVMIVQAKQILQYY